MGDLRGRTGAVNLGPFVGVDLNLWPTVHIDVIVLTRTLNESNQICEVDVERAHEHEYDIWIYVSILSFAPLHAAVLDFSLPVT